MKWFKFRVKFERERLYPGFTQGTWQHYGPLGENRMGGSSWAVFDTLSIYVGEVKLS